MVPIRSVRKHPAFLTKGGKKESHLGGKATQSERRKRQAATRHQAGTQHHRHRTAPFTARDLAP